MLRDYLPVLLQIIVAVGFAASALIVSVPLGKAGRLYANQRFPLRMRDGADR